MDNYFAKLVIRTPHGDRISRAKKKRIKRDYLSVVIQVARARVVGPVPPDFGRLVKRAMRRTLLAVERVP